MLFNHAGYWSLNGSACCIRLDLSAASLPRTARHAFPLILFIYFVGTHCHRILSICANKLAPPPYHLTSPHLPTTPHPHRSRGALTCCTTTIAEKHQRALEQCSLGREFTHGLALVRARKHTQTEHPIKSSSVTSTHAHAHTRTKQTHQLGSCFS